ncbi:hypothetical protein [Vibrio sp. Vb339]|uniref:hypothetical protein n=1 Tax=Vibrio sp. Vb339 TaxID=1192013 RepID=UPI001553AAD7|nr:hypothetical protein [Vibrio sp. Vb339]
MKVLVYGEFSGYGKSIAKGLSDNGIQSDVFSVIGDGWKDIQGDFSIRNGNKAAKLLQLLKFIPRILSYDHILVVNPIFMDFKYLGPLILFLARMKGIKLHLLCCGDDYEFVKQGKAGRLGEWPYIDIELPSKQYYSTFSDRIIHRLVARSVVNIIPTMYDYAEAWRLSNYSCKVRSTVPLACDGEPIECIKITKNKLTIMHGINRPGFKGSEKIINALNRLKSEYPNRVNIVLPEKLPLVEYLKVMKDVDIAIDQTKGNSYGMNAIYSMFNGQIVLAPANKKFDGDVGIKNNPLVKIFNCESNIYNNLEDLIKKENSELDKIKVKSISYACELHSPKVVASKLLKIICDN